MALLKDTLKNRLSPRQVRWFRKIYTSLASFGSDHRLDKLAQIYKTDKGGDHFYTAHYETYFRKFRNKKISLLEIGVGGYDVPDLGGASLRMWKKYFPRGRIYAFDIYDKSQYNEHRIKIFKGDQNDPDFLHHLAETLPELDIIIDDGSHINRHVILSFEKLFPSLKTGGIYVIEDTQTSYWKDYGGSGRNNPGTPTIMNYFKRLCDGLNYKEFREKDYSPDYFDQHIKSIHFYHNLIFIHKGLNND